MKWASLALGVVAAAMLAVFSTRFLSSSAPEASLAAPGLAAVEAYRCRPGETKRITMRGIEDNYAPGNAEPATRHKRLVLAGVPPNSLPSAFDSNRPDTSVNDHFELAPNTAAAIVVIKAKPLGDNANDTVTIGDFTTIPQATTPRELLMYQETFARMLQSGIWNRAQDVYWAELGDLPLQRGDSLLDLVRTHDQPRIIDIEILDDTAVDFVATVACESPQTAAGITFVPIDKRTTSPEITMFGCHGNPYCPAYTGNRPCTDTLPLLCFIDRRQPAPGTESDFIKRNWSGGEVAATSAVRGDSFRTIADADGHCAKQFGTGWQVAEWHLGGTGSNFSAASGGRRFSGEHWVDIKNAPYGTCWRRNDDAD
jgi:hypothetical protein